MTVLVIPTDAAITDKQHHKYNVVVYTSRISSIK